MEIFSLPNFTYILALDMKVLIVDLQYNCQDEFYFNNSYKRTDIGILLKINQIEK